MVIDTHIHPALFAPICEDQAEKVKHLLRTNFHLLFCLILT